MHELPELTPENYINRELSWIDFNRRVLAQAMDESIPLLERIKFLAIVSSNTDEFFMVRVATVHKKLKLGLQARRPDARALRGAARRNPRARARHDAPPARDHARTAGSAARIRRRHHRSEQSRPDVAGRAARLLLRGSFSGADAAGGRSRAPVPVHLQPQLEPRRLAQARRRPERRAGIRPPENPGWHPAPDQRQRRAAQVRQRRRCSGRGDHDGLAGRRDRAQPRSAVSGHEDHRSIAVPRHPQRRHRLRARAGRPGSRHQRDRRGEPARAALRLGRPLERPRRDQHAHAQPADQSSRRRFTARRLSGQRGAGRQQLDGTGGARPARPEISGLSAAPARRDRRRRGHLLGDPQARLPRPPSLRTRSCRSRPSSKPPPATRTCWRSR